jgi:hypothetical protein
MAVSVVLYFSLEYHNSRENITYNSVSKILVDIGNEAWINLFGNINGKLFAVQFNFPCYIFPLLSLHLLSSSISSSKFQLPFPYPFLSFSFPFLLLSSLSPCPPAFFYCLSFSLIFSDFFTVPLLSSFFFFTFQVFISLYSSVLQFLCLFPFSIISFLSSFFLSHYLSSSIYPTSLLPLFPLHLLQQETIQKYIIVDHTPIGAAWAFYIERHI